MKKSKQILKNIPKKSFFLYGKHAVLSALSNPQRKKYKLYITEKHKEEAKNFGKQVKIKIITKQEFENLFPNVVHQDIALEVEHLEQPNIINIIKQDKDNSLLIILDQIKDPHNIGAIIRSAAAFGVIAVINTKYNSPTETAVIAKSACGALEKVPYINATNLINVINIIKKHNYWCYGLDGKAKESLPNNFPQKTCFIFGSEENGIRKLIRENCDELYKIKILAQVESLNVSNAASITMHNFFASHS